MPSRHPRTSVSLADVHDQAIINQGMPPGEDPGKGSAQFEPEAAAYGFGSAAALVSVDAEIEDVDVERFVMVQLRPAREPHTIGANRACSTCHAWVATGLVSLVLGAVALGRSLGCVLWLGGGIGAVWLVVGDGGELVAPAPAEVGFDVLQRTLGFLLVRAGLGGAHVQFMLARGEFVGALLGFEQLLSQPGRVA
jgi:hypothetical protein